MLEMFACIMMLIFIAVGAFLFYSQVVDKAPIYDLPLSQLNPLNCWRFILCGSILSGATLLITHLNFPDTRWNNQVWLGVGIGLLPGLLIGWIWQLIIHEALSSYLRRYVLIATLFSAAFFLSVFGSNMFSELNQEQFRIEQMKLIHSLANRNIWEVSIKFESSETVNIRDREHIESLKEFFADAKLFHLTREDDPENFKIEIHTDIEDIAYDAFIPRSYQDDIALQAIAGEYDTYFRLPGLKRWLDENILNKEK